MTQPSYDGFVALELCGDNPEELYREPEVDEPGEPGEGTTVPEDGGEGPTDGREDPPEPTEPTP